MSTEKEAIYFLSHYRELKDHLIALDAHIVKATNEFSGYVSNENSVSATDARKSIRKEILQIHDTILEASDTFPENKKKLREEFAQEMNWHITPNNTRQENMKSNYVQLPEHKELEFKTIKKDSHNTNKLGLMILLIAAQLFTSACSSRAVYDSAGGAAGGAIGYYASDGDPLVTAAGAAGGVLVSEGIQSQVKKGQVQQYNRGYDRGRSDAIKEQYWIMQNNHKKDNDTEPLKLRYYAVPAPTEVNTKGGVVRTVPSTVVIPVVADN